MWLTYAVDEDLYYTHSGKSVMVFEVIGVKRKMRHHAQNWYVYTSPMLATLTTERALHWGRPAQMNRWLDVGQGDFDTAVGIFDAHVAMMRK